MLGFQYREVLKRVAEESFPDKKILPFKIEIYPKEMKTRHGDYNPNSRVIRIFNLSQKIEYTIATALHELAHHCEYSIYGASGHSKRFYTVFKSILETAISMGIVEYESIRNQENASDIRMLEKHVGPVTILAKTMQTNDEIVLKVSNSYSHKELLSKNGYFYDPVEKVWGKMIHTSQLEIERIFLLQHVAPSSITVRSLFDLTFEAIYYLFVPNAYEQRSTLKENGYFYKVMKNKKGWAKKIISTNLDEEKKLLLDLSIKDFIVTSQLK